ncbi:hypothetical protein [Luteolibacter marinus]|uniref:hypothetical protein n=1 Tax=Luteolibacter marinus TaxID=2776705 RepID=UPI001865B73F|nr:hypothetical protein [Luteolibacter marinus]
MLEGFRLCGVEAQAFGEVEHRRPAGLTGIRRGHEAERSAVVHAVAGERPASASERRIRKAFGSRARKRRHDKRQEKLHAAKLSDGFFSGNAKWLPGFPCVLKSRVWNVERLMDLAGA